MAGLGFKDFQVGEVLTSADVDGYLMQQTVMRFADAAARGSALGTASGVGTALAQGMVAYLDDVDRVEQYTGSSWLPVSLLLGAQNALVTTNQTVSSTSYVDLAGATVTVTPSSASSRFVVLFYANMNVTGTVENRVEVRRDGTRLGDELEQQMNSGEEDTVVFMAIDSPATTSSVTYDVRAKVSTATAVYTSSSLIVMELRA